MVVVVFEVVVKEGKDEGYLEEAARLKPLVEQMDGFISIERFRSLADPRKLVSYSVWRDLDAVNRWRADADHQMAQRRGREDLFESYTIRIAEVVREKLMAPAR